MSNILYGKSINDIKEIGEQEFCEFLEDFNDDFPREDLTVYHEPLGVTTFPDFAIKFKKLGLIYFEIKSFSIHNVIEFNNQQCKHNAYEGISKLKFGRQFEHKKINQT